MDNYAQIENGISLYLQDGVCIPSGSVIDEKAEAVLLDTDRGNGIIDPHIPA